MQYKRISRHSIKHCSTIKWIKFQNNLLFTNNVMQFFQYEFTFVLTNILYSFSKCNRCSKSIECSNFKPFRRSILS